MGSSSLAVIARAASSSSRVSRARTATSSATNAVNVACNAPPSTSAWSVNTLMPGRTACASACGTFETRPMTSSIVGIVVGSWMVSSAPSPTLGRNGVSPRVSLA